MDLKKKILVGYSSCGIAAGADRVYEKLKELSGNNEVELQKTGCIGMCYQEPLVEVIDSSGSILYGKVDDKKCEEIFKSHILENKLLVQFKVDEDYFKKQVRIVLSRCGKIDPEKISDYVESNGYKAVEKVLKNISPEAVIEMVKKSGLRGRGGAGFSTGVKWGFARSSVSDKKYIICNADEGDPGAFMDRSVLEGDPHSVLEGMLIAAYAIGASYGYIYCRAEYPLAVKRLRIAVFQAREKGFLGKNILGTNFSFDVDIFKGAGAFVCGEETALMASIMGNRGMPRLRPPFPAVSGIWGKPTNINNVETYANVPWIILNGAEKYASFGTEKSKGTKVFALAGKIKRGGLIEVPMGISLREIIFDVGGGIKEDKKFKAVQIGGPSGGCIPEDLLDIPVDYDSITKTGAIMGSGGMVVIDEDNCMVDIAKFFLRFTQDESCGKCTFCRVGTRRMLEILEKISQGDASIEDLDKLKELALKVKEASLCGLGQTAPNPVLTTLKYFYKEYEAHILEKKCPAGSCRALINFKINPEKCTGCTLCVRVCPVKAIKGEVKEAHEIDVKLCVKCGICYKACKFKAVEIISAGEKVK